MGSHKLDALRSSCCQGEWSLTCVFLAASHDQARLLAAPLWSALESVRLHGSIVAAPRREYAGLFTCPPSSPTVEQWARRFRILEARPYLYHCTVRRNACVGLRSVHCRYDTVESGDPPRSPSPTQIRP